MFGRRSDGHLVKKLDPIVALTSYIMPTRCDAQIFTDYKADFEKLARYIAAKSDEGYRITFMEIIIAAYIRTVSQLPEINRFVANKRLVRAQRAGRILRPGARFGRWRIVRNTTKCYFDLNDTIYDVSDRIRDTVEACRKEDADNSTLKVAKLLMNPFLANIVVWLARVLDRYGIMPRWLLNASPFHTSMFVTNMASIGLPAIQHHIYNFGTCSQFVSIGSVERGVALDAKGNVVRKRLLPLGVCATSASARARCTPRCSASWAACSTIPEQLEQPPERVLYDEGHEFHLPEPKRHRFFRKGKEESVQA